MRPLPSSHQAAHQQGATTVEFALVLVVFFTLLFGVLDLGRVMLAMNSAAEATVLGARVAAVCQKNSTYPLERMREIMPELNADNVSIDYLGANGGSCDGTKMAPCYLVRVAIDGDQLQLSSLTGLTPYLLPMPDFKTALPVEALSSTYAPDLCL